MKKSCVMFTPGIDSFYMLMNFKSDIQHHDYIYFDCVSKYSDIEKRIIEKNYPFVKIVDGLRLQQYEQQNSHIENRNFLFSMFACTMGYDTIYIGGTRSDRVNDNNEPVMNQLSDFLTVVNGRKITITSPFWNLYKHEVGELLIREARNTDPHLFQKMKTSIISHSFSCYNPTVDDGSNGHHCLSCSACFRRNVEIFYQFGYFINTLDSDLVNQYNNRVNSQIMQNPREVVINKYIRRWENINGR